MTTLYLIVPEATTNLVSNPSIENNTTGYTAVGGSVTRSADDQRRGVYSLKVNIPNAANNGAYYAITLSTTTTYAYSFDFKGTSGRSYQAYLYDVTAAATLGTAISWTDTGEWVRHEGTATTGANTSIRLYIIRPAALAAEDVYLDGVQIEEKAYATTYCDGDQQNLVNVLPDARLGYRWLGVRGSSQSQRSAVASGGGRRLDIETLGGTYNANVKDVIGLGKPPERHNIQEFALLDGARLLSVKNLPRPITIQLRTDVTGFDPNPGTYTVRQQIEQYIKHARLPNLQPLLIEWADTGNRLPVYYEGGFEGEWLAGCGWEDILLRFQAYTPWWFEDGQEGASLDFRQDVSNFNYGGRRVDGKWYNFGGGTGPNFPVYAIAANPDNPNELWLGGAFTSIGGTAHNRAAIYDIENDTFTQLCAGTGFNQLVFDILFHPNGDIYFTGQFTSVCGTAANYVVRYTPSTTTWSALGAGLNNIGYALALEKTTGDVFVGGAFTQAGGAAANRIAKWDVSAGSFVTLGTSPNDGLGSTVNALEYGNDDLLYIGGSFTTLGDGTTSNRIASWDGSSMSAFSVGLNNTVRALRNAPNGGLYIGGTFTATSPAGTTANAIIFWNGSQFQALGAGITGAGNGVEDIAVGPDGLVYAVGAVTAPFTAPVVIWNGSVWVNFDLLVAVGAAQSGLTALVTENNDFFMGYNDALTGESSAINTVTNSGTAIAYPRIKLIGGGAASPTNVQWIENQTTGDRLYMDMTVLEGEEITIDTAPERQSITSSLGRSVYDGILDGSNLGTFKLIPGANTVAVFATNTDSDTKVEMVWDIRHLSADGGVL